MLLLNVKENGKQYSWIYSSILNSDIYVYLYCVLFMIIQKECETMPGIKCRVFIYIGIWNYHVASIYIIQYDHSKHTIYNR